MEIRELKPYVHHQFALTVYFLDGGFAELGNVATVKVENDKAIYRLGPQSDGEIVITTDNMLDVLNERCVNSVHLKDRSERD